MRIAIIQFPGSNCERETSLAVARAGMTPVPCLWSMPDSELAAMDGYIIVGGFSFEDRGRAGVIAALHPVMQTIKQQSELGKPVLGICNGAQILVETGLVPGFKDYPLCTALTNNKRVADGNVLGTGFYNAWVHLRQGTQSRQNAFNRTMAQTDIIEVPIAHAEGRFVMAPDVLKEVQEQGLIAWQYCDSKGQVSQAFPNNPNNPNGSIDNIAAIVNPAGNVMAMMPHPERTPAGDAIFTSMRDYIASKPKAISTLPNIVIDNIKPQPFQPKANTHTFLVDLIINDNTAFTMTQAFKQQMSGVTIKRLQYWSIQCESQSVLYQVQASGVLFNSQKEYLVSLTPEENQRCFLVQAKEDMLGQEKKQHLAHHFHIDGIGHIEHGVLWIVVASEPKLNDAVEAIFQSNMLFNPVSHVCYAYE